LSQGSWDIAWQTAVELSTAALRAENPHDRCLNAGAHLDDQAQVALLDYLGQPHQVSWSDFEVISKSTGQPLPARERVLLLHYLERASGTPPKGDWIGFNQVPGAELYLGNYRARSVERLLREFAGQENAVVEAGRTMGARESEYGDVSIELLPLPRVPVALVLWRGDDEFPGSGNLLLDATVSEYLSIEDMVVLAEMVASRLCAAHRNDSDGST
jgi:hypothetical protein